MSQWAREHPEQMEEIARLPLPEHQNALREAMELDEEQRNWAKDPPRNASERAQWREEKYDATDQYHEDE